MLKLKMNIKKIQQAKMSTPWAEPWGCPKHRQARTPLPNLHTFFVSLWSIHFSHCPQDPINAKCFLGKGSHSAWGPSRVPGIKPGTATWQGKHYKFPKSNFPQKDLSHNNHEIILHSPLMVLSLRFFVYFSILDYTQWSSEVTPGSPALKNYPGSAWGGIWDGGIESRSATARQTTYTQHYGCSPRRRTV